MFDNPIADLQLKKGYPMLKVDYIRLTTADKTAMQAIWDYYDKQKYNTNGLGDRLTKIMQFTGYLLVDSGLFVGSMLGRNLVEYTMLQVGGIDAHKAYGALHKYDVRVTRMDIACTVEADDTALAVFDTLVGQREVSGFKDTTNKSLKWTFIEGSNGLDTFYVGSRKSDFYRRNYIKEIEGSRYIRYELELKGTIARSIKPGTFCNAMMFGLFYKAYHFLVNSGLDDVFNWLMEQAESKGELVLPDKPVKETLNKEWVNDIVVPYLVKAVDIDSKFVESVVQRLASKLLFGDTSLLGIYYELGVEGIQEDAFRAYEEKREILARRYRD